MGLLPGTENRTANPVSTRPLVRLLWIIVHTIVGTVAGSLSGRHYHFYIRANGSVVQRQRYDLRSAASVEANPYSIAITLEDMGPAFGPWSGNNVPAMTRAQVDSLVRIIALLCARSGLPPDYVLSSCINSGRGLRWHRLGIDGNFPGGILRGRIPGCQRWSNSRGKGCPGDRRIRQIVNEVIPRVRAVLRGAPTPPPKPSPPPEPEPTPEDDDMPTVFRVEADGQTQLWLTNGITRRQVRDQIEVNNLVMAGLARALPEVGHVVDAKGNTNLRAAVLAAEQVHVEAQKALNNIFAVYAGGFDSDQDPDPTALHKIVRQALGGA